MAQKRPRFSRYRGFQKYLNHEAFIEVRVKCIEAKWQKYCDRFGQWPPTKDLLNELRCEALKELSPKHSCDSDTET